MSITGFYNSMKLVYKLKCLPEVKGENLSENNNICLICFQEIKIGKMLGCGHAYHQNCIRTWIESNSTNVALIKCPKCKKPINLDTPKPEEKN